MSSLSRLSVTTITKPLTAEISPTAEQKTKAPPPPPRARAKKPPLRNLTTRLREELTNTPP